MKHSTASSNALANISKQVNVAGDPHVSLPSFPHRRESRPRSFPFRGFLVSECTF